MRELKKFYVRTYGCQMNELDSEIMAGMLEQRGLEKVDEEEEADLLIFNTCSIRDLAERKVLGKLGRLGRSNKRALIGVTGCMANAKKDSLFQKVPNIDFVLGTNNIHDLNNVLDEVLSTGKQAFRTDDKFTFELDYAATKREDKVKAHISISRGCDKFCTYCVVPYTRGPEVSRAPESIIEECRRLANLGYKEISLLGQNVNSYGKDHPEWNCLFHDLLYRIAPIEGIERIRFMTSHPVDITEELMIALRDIKKMCNFVHFPFQAGSNRVLKKMHRIYTIEQYMEKVRMLKEYLPNVAFGTDVIVGFPTETHEDFLETKKILQEVEFDVAFLFAFSQRKGTPAMRWKETVSEIEKEERLQELMAIQDEIYARKRQAFLGTEVEVLVECVNFRDASMLKGRTTCWKNVLFPGDPSLIGTLQKVKVHSYSHQTLLGELSTPYHVAAQDRGVKMSGLRVINS
ncbi:MAG: tRNA (N6-isopentenyl adenosine(37)-C2)-methylthiotransferase MiaB [Parachlamydiales bacterium]